MYENLVLRNLGLKTSWAESWENQRFAYAKTKTQISFAVTAKLISAFVFAIWILQYLFFLNPKFQACSHLKWLYSLVCVRPGQNPHCWFSFVAAHLIYCLFKDQDNVPMAGGTVFVKRKACQYPPDAKIGSDVHQHIRRFMITRQPTTSSYSLNGRPKSSASRPKSAWWPDNIIMLKKNFANGRHVARLDMTSTNYFHAQ